MGWVGIIRTHRLRDCWNWATNCSSTAARWAPRTALASEVFGGSAEGVLTERKRDLCSCWVVQQRGAIAAVGPAWMRVAKVALSPEMLVAKFSSTNLSVTQSELITQAVNQ